MSKVYYWLLIVRLSLRWIGKPNLGDDVLYQGERWTLIQGLRDPIWTLIRTTGTGIEEYRHVAEVHRDEFRKVAGIHAAWRSFRSGYRFYMQNWFDIWVREGIKPWMRGCSIWAGKPPRSAGEQS
jgi:hypothetical protein